MLAPRLPAPARRAGFRALAGLVYAAVMAGSGPVAAAGLAAVPGAPEPSPVFLPALLRGGGFAPRPLSTPAPAPSPTVAAPGRVVLGEVGLEPAAGEAPFVELTNLGPGPAEVAGLGLTNRLAETYRLPLTLPPLAADARLLVRFDGAGRVDGATVHADRGALVRPTGDRLLLTAADGARLDEVAWGVAERDAVRLGPGGVVPPPVAGASLSRLPGATAVGPDAWARTLPADASPGRANTLPAVEAFPMIDGLVTAPGEVSLAWYDAPGARGYRVQLASDEAFTMPIADTQVVSATFRTPHLSPGRYFWRVEASGADGAAARFSRPLALTIEAGAAVRSDPLAGRDLQVPLLKQRKDTRMLLLESTHERGAHAWDVAHPDLSTSDRADNTNCGLATVAMVAAYFGGTVSQDRLGLERFRDLRPGPELDLKWGQDLNGFDVVDLMQWAVGPGVVAYWAVNSVESGRDDPVERAAFWETVKLSVDNGQPLAVCGGGHCVVVTGYSEGLLGRRLRVNDPWFGQIVVGADNLAVMMYAIPPVGATGRQDEPEISSDGDGDGIVDFDETQRFGTNPGAKDTDGDEVADKDEVRMSVFDGDHAYAFWGDARNDIDGDGTAPELDDDADDGGCADGLEDLDHDGRVAQGSETSPYDKADDKCLAGTWRLWNDQNVPLEGGGFQHSWIEITGRFSLKPTEGGKLEGHGTFTYDAGGESQQPSECAHFVYDMPLIRWESDLTGTFQENTVVVDTAPTTAQGTLTGRNNCGHTATEPVTAAWPGGGGTLVDGVYDERFDFPLVPGATGESYIAIHIERSPAWGGEPVGQAVLLVAGP